MLLRSGMDGNATGNGLRTHMCPLLPRDPWEAPCDPTWSTHGVSGCRAARRSAGGSAGDPGRPSSSPSHQDPNSVTRWCPEPRASRPGHFRPLNPSTTGFSSPRPPISVSSRIEEWAEGGGVVRLNHSYFCVSRWCGAGPGAPGEAGAGRGRGHLPARPGGGGLSRPG